jgi:two-component system, OmpR family, phosphate regulon response regulator PhoB
MSQVVLIIEDDPDIAECLRLGLESAQLATRVALTGEEGLSASLDKNNPPAAILLDLLLPGMSGIEICRRLRQTERKHIPIIVVTAKVSEADRAATLAVGADDYITKPFSIRDVVQRVSCLLQKSCDARRNG